MNTPSTKFSTLKQTAIEATLRASRIFFGLPPDAIEKVAECCVTKKLSKGETLFHEDDEAEGFFIIQTGRISIFRLTPDGGKQIVHVFGPLESFAEIVLASKGGYPAGAVALEATQLVLVRKVPLLRLLEQRPQLPLMILASMSMHLKQLVQHLHDLKGRQIEGRLAAWLLRQPATTPASEDGASVIMLEQRKKVLASQLGVTSETLSRTFARLRTEGVLRVDAKKIHVMDYQALTEYADGRRILPQQNSRQKKPARPKKR